MMISCEPQDGADVLSRTPSSPGTEPPRREDPNVAIQAKLDAGVPADRLAQRSGPGNQKITYIEGHMVIDSANQIFGFNGWSSDIIDITVDYMEEQNKKWHVGVTAIVRITLASGEAYHEDLGFASSIDKDKGSCIGNAKKSAVTDAMKRALRCFGDALGNSVYSKEKVKQAKVVAKDTATAGRPGPSAAVPRLQPPPPPGGPQQQQQNRGPPQQAHHPAPPRPTTARAPAPPPQSLPQPPPQSAPPQRAAAAPLQAAAARPPAAADPYFDGVDLSNFDFEPEAPAAKRPCPS